MRVFISSVIHGLEPYRQAVADAIESLGYTAIRAEDFAARTETPRRACLEAAREADLTILVLGDRYGDVQESGLSATHEEFREARDHGAVAAFVREGVDPEPVQADFIGEVQAWATGHFSQVFKDPSDLRFKATQALHRHVLRLEGGNVNPVDVIARARALLPRHRNRWDRRLHTVMAGGPRREVVPAAQLEGEALRQGIMQRALFGPDTVFLPSQGTSARIVEDALLVEQKDSSVLITEDGAVRVEVPVGRSDRDLPPSVPVLIEEDVRAGIATSLGFAVWLLEEVDPNHRISEVVVLAALEGASYLGWQTRAEHAANPGRVTIPMQTKDLAAVPEHPRLRPRAALAVGRSEIVEDLLVRLRRDMRS